MHKALLSLTSREVERALRKKGFRLERQKGSHKQFVGFIKDRKRKVTVIANKKRFAPETLKSIIRQSGISEEEWLDMINKK